MASPLCVISAMTMQAVNYGASRVKLCAATQQRHTPTARALAKLSAGISRGPCRRQVGRMEREREKEERENERDRKAHAQREKQREEYRRDAIHGSRMRTAGRALPPLGQQSAFPLSPRRPIVVPLVCSRRVYPSAWRDNDTLLRPRSHRRPARESPDKEGISVRICIYTTSNVDSSLLRSSRRAYLCARVRSPCAPLLGFCPQWKRKCSLCARIFGLAG